MLFTTAVCERSATSSSPTKFPTTTCIRRLGAQVSILESRNSGLDGLGMSYECRQRGYPRLSLGGHTPAGRRKKSGEGRGTGNCESQDLVEERHRCGPMAHWGLQGLEEEECQFLICHNSKDAILNLCREKSVHTTYSLKNNSLLDQNNIITMIKSILQLYQ